MFDDGYSVRNHKLVRAGCERDCFQRCQTGSGIMGHDKDGGARGGDLGRGKVLIVSRT